jgi:hypothetical protein
VPDPDLHHQGVNPIRRSPRVTAFPLTKPIVGIGGHPQGCVSVHSGAIEPLSSVLNRISSVD